MKRFIEGECRTQLTLIPECLEDSPCRTCVARKSPENPATRLATHNSRYVTKRNGTKENKKASKFRGFCFNSTSYKTL